MELHVAGFVQQTEPVPVLPARDELCLQPARLIQQMELVDLAKEGALTKDEPLTRDRLFLRGLLKVRNIGWFWRGGG